MNENIILDFNDLGLLRQWERLVLFAYPDPASPLAVAIQKAGLWEEVLSGRQPIPQKCRTSSAGVVLLGDPWTIGYGHTGKEVHEHLVWAESMANSVLVNDSLGSQQCVRDNVKIPLTKDQMVACVDLIHNIGQHAFATSTLLRLLNLHDIQGAADQFRVWNIAGGKVNNGLVNRREADRALFILGSDFT